jgi:hypothetical protein
MTKTPEEMAEEYALKLLQTQILFKEERLRAREAFLAGYKAAQEHAHAALEEAEVRIQELQDQLADADKVMPQWISVKDRLPDEEIDVLVCCEITINGNLTKHQQVIRFIGGNWDTSLPGSITYWQVLPKLPKEDK